MKLVHSCTLEEWNQFFPVQIHHFKVVVLQPEAKENVKPHRILDKSCKKQKSQEIINHDLSR